MPRITKTQLVKLFDLKAEAAALSSRARTLKAEADRIEQAVEVELTSSGKSKISRGGYAITFDVVKASVSWKNALVDAMGVEHVAKVQADAGTKQKLSITPPAKPPEPKA